MAYDHRFQGSPLPYTNFERVRPRLDLIGVSNVISTFRCFHAKGEVRQRQVLRHNDGETTMGYNPKLTTPSRQSL